MNYEREMRIDETALDVEWADQATLAMKWGRHWADAKKELTLAEEEIKIIRSELIAHVNEDPQECCNKEKPNAADIEAYYRNHRRHKRAKTKIVELQYALNIAEVAKNEFSFTRKAALENLVNLHAQQYFAGPKIPRNLHQEVQKKRAQEKADNAVSGKMRRRK